DGAHDRLELLAVRAELGGRLRANRRGAEVVRDRQAEPDLALRPRARRVAVEHELAEQAARVDDRDEGERSDALAAHRLLELAVEAGLGDVGDENGRRV